MSDSVYLDYAATTPIAPEVFEAMRPYFDSVYGNPSSLHQKGREAKKALQEAKQKIAACIGAVADEIIFTSGGTEGNNLAVFGVCEAMQSLGKHIITTSIEHHSVLKACQELEQKGYEITYLNPDETGCITVEQVRAALRPDTTLVSVMYVNNETGSVQPIAEIAELLTESETYFHTDAVQAFGTEKIDVSLFKVDLLTMSGHKVNAPKGIGFLYIKENTKLHPLFFGGSQQRKLRPGTENIPYIVGLATACQMHCENRAQKREHLWQMKMELLSRLRQKQIKFSINGSEAASAPHIVSLCFPEISLSGFLTSLDLDGVCVSGGSACTSGSVRGSHVLIAMYQETDARVLSSVRFSFGIYTDLTDIKRVVVSIEKYIQRTKCLKG